MLCLLFFLCVLHAYVYVVIYVYVVFMLSPRQHCHQKKIPVWANKSYLTYLIVVYLTCKYLYLISYLILI